jgi:hypothetical protein
MHAQRPSAKKRGDVRPSISALMLGSLVRIVGKLRPPLDVDIAVAVCLNLNVQALVAVEASPFLNQCRSPCVLVMLKSRAIT